MDFLYSAASIWTIVVWIIGAITITALLIRTAVRCARAISNRLWVRSAMQAWEREMKDYAHDQANRSKSEQKKEDPAQ